jgi:hypothetical protein
MCSGDPLAGDCAEALEKQVSAVITDATIKPSGERWVAALQKILANRRAGKTDHAFLPRPLRAWLNVRLNPNRVNETMLRIATAQMQRTTGIGSYGKPIFKQAIESLVRRGSYPEKMIFMTTSG